MAPSSSSRTARAAWTGVSAGSASPAHSAARALLGLWRVQADSLRKHLDQAPTTARLNELVTADVRRAARLIDTGLRTFAAPDALLLFPNVPRTPGGPS